MAIGGDMSATDWRSCSIGWSVEPASRRAEASRHAEHARAV